MLTALEGCPTTLLQAMPVRDIEQALFKRLSNGQMDGNYFARLASA
ncbi:hypothetical protein [Roseateles aquae]|nr:hypothetical protein [Paucibacter sp. APW11]